MAKVNDVKTSAGTAKAESAAPAIPKVPPMFRKMDWVTAFIAFAVIWTVYFLTLSPELTLEDSGELTTASFYAGIPHPPGYPVWTIYSWLWTVLLPIKNIAWRVSLGEATAAAFACGLLALMVSRGSSMLIEGIDELKTLTGQWWETAICMVSGSVAGILMGLDGFMWRESVVINRISLFGVPWLMVVLLCLMRWMYAPHQRRYLYFAMFFFGICATIHQTLICAAMGIEVAIAFVQPRLGRDLLLGNSIVFAAATFAKMAGILTIFDGSNPTIFAIFNVVGIASVVGCFLLTVKTAELGTYWKVVIIMGFLWLLGAGFYFYMPISGMTNPPMQWGYPRTVDGFFHALTRGQYEKTSPTDIFNNPGRFALQLGMLVNGIAEEFNWVYVFIGLLPFLFIFKMQKRERAWIVTIASLYVCLGVLLMILMNPNLDRSSAGLVKVFFTASHTLAALMIGYGLALTAAYMANNYKKFRHWGLLGGALAAVLTVIFLRESAGQLYFGLDGKVSWSELPHWVGQAFNKDQYGLPIYADLILLALALLFIFALCVYRNRAPLAITLGIFAIMPLHPGLSHWFESEQRDHMFGYWFGHDMFTPPFKSADGKSCYPEMTKDSVLFGGTDPGRFCPTYMIFCESFIPHSCQPKEDQQFDRRDVYLITQNALADGTYLNYIRAHYNRSTQIDPPFFQNFLPTVLPRFFHGPTPGLGYLDDMFTSLGAKIEKRRRTSTSYFKEDDFTNLPQLVAKLKKGAQQDKLSSFLYDKLSKDTQSLLDNNGDDKALRRALAKDFNAIIDGDSIYQADRFKDIKLPTLIEQAVKVDQLKNTTIRLNRRVIEEAYSGAIAKSLGGVYPDTEIHTPTPTELQQCFDTYLADAAKRVEHDQRFPNEQPQIKPGEDVHTENGRVQVSGQVAVMSINGLLTKVIFDANPDHDFYVEESFPLDWMYPYLTPYGVIMKINRQPLPEITQSIADTDHHFWKEYSKRFTGDFIDYDTPVKDIADWIERTYLRHDFSQFSGDRKFIRDEDAQKAFSKLRSSIGGIYQWRTQHPANEAERARMYKEADFAFKQAFAFCPYSPEAVYRYVQLLINLGRAEDALIVARTCLKLDPFNSSIENLISQIGQIENNKKSMGLQGSVLQAQTLLQQGKKAEADQLLDQIAANSQADIQVLTFVASLYLQENNGPKAEKTIERMVEVAPEAAENWYNLASVRAAQGKITEVYPALQKALTLNDRARKANSKAPNIREHVLKDRNFDALRQQAEFKKIVGG